MLNYKWTNYGRYVIYQQFSIFVIFLFIYSTYTIFIFPSERLRPDPTLIDITMGRISRVIFLLAGAYYGYREMKQLLVEGFDDYFDSIWNLLDMGSSLGLIVSVGFDFFEAPHDYLIGTYSIVSLLLWLKCLYHARCFEATGRLVRMIV